MNEFRSEGMHPVQVVSTTHGQPLSEGDIGSDKADKGEVVDVVDIENKIVTYNGTIFA